MKYFIDFEATQFTNEIISVGCVREDNEEFYSLVCPSNGKVNAFIANLTGITTELIQNAESANKVFEDFYDWVFETDTNPEFFVWGNSDCVFTKATFAKTTSLKARMMLGYLCGSIQDYSAKFVKKVHLKSCSLIRAYHLLIDGFEQQIHNALFDARYLKAVYDMAHIISLAELEGVFAKEVDNAEKEKANWPVGTIYVVNDKGERCGHWSDIGQAAQWVVKTKVPKNQTDVSNVEKIKRKIFNGIKGGNKYCNLHWKEVKF